MKPIVTLLVVLALAGGAYLLFDGSEDPQETAPDSGDAVLDGATGSDPDPETDETSPGAATLAASSTDEATQLPELAALKTPASVLFIGKSNDTWTATVTEGFALVPELAYVSWFFDLADRGGLDGLRPGAGPRRGLPELQTQPSGEYLEANDIRALFLDSFDPNALGKSFWEIVARRVKSGRMGLLVRPNFPPSAAGNAKWAAVHPMLTHPILKDLLPIQKAKAIKGRPLPGVYSRQAQGLRVTQAGTKHPATRLVPNQHDSQSAWNSTATGSGAFMTKFVYPVESPRSGPQVLVDMENGDYPAVIVSEGSTRVLWLGNGDYGDSETHKANDKRKMLYILLTHMTVWLVNQAD